MARPAFVTAVLIMVLLLISGTIVEAQSPPHVFVGEATLDGAIVPDGTVIQAIVNGQPLPQAQTSVREGKFTLIVEQPEGVGAGQAAVGFSVGNFLAEQSQPWELGAATLLMLSASSTLPPVVAEIASPVPQRLFPGEKFLLTVKADTGFYQATGGEIKVNLDPQVFTASMADVASLPGRTQRVLVDGQQVRAGWSYQQPSSTAVFAGELLTVPLQVTDSAPAGSTSLAIEVNLRGINGQPFVLEPSEFFVEITVVSMATDLNEDNVVDFADLAVLGSVWGKRQGEVGFQPDFDLDSDGTIWIGDLIILLQNYGETA